MKPPPRRAVLSSLLSPFILPASLMLAAPAPATAQVGVSIGIHIGSYPKLVRVPSYPVYYAPGLAVNLFFYDGLYWVFADDRWYTSPWYDGPWDWVDPFAVPLYVLRIPVRYYRVPPPYFRPWRADAPPRWGEHWGPDWNRRNAGWDRWDRRAAPAPAPLPTYQRPYSGPRYPGTDEQRALQQRHYRYQPREAVARERVQPGPAQPRAPRAEPPREPRPSAPVQRPPEAPRAQPPEQRRPAPPHNEPSRAEPRPAEPRREFTAPPRPEPLQRGDGGRPPGGHERERAGPAPDRDPGRGPGQRRGEDREPGHDRSR